jgi:uncharacterized membrane-anchored protein YhcB (DUF1043 family)
MLMLAATTVALSLLLNATFDKTAPVSAADQQLADRIEQIEDRMDEMDREMRKHFSEMRAALDQLAGSVPDHPR